ncbi:MAG: bifunctional adenosylcobinamide kinase/adenosylcobinamide-phosphate guanylyltransferase [Alphaproteobacteria bacterium]|nr:bifunctional adenosylcobinamide kinase/adenosylcobinamide-phosphate guanylyltransferase [Alphaproteobacteria bacterium]
MGAMLPPLTLVLGGARSGKSAYAESLVDDDGRPPVYVATGSAGDDEMAARIARHRERRGKRWETIEEPLDLAEVLSRTAARDTVLLVDCLTLWLTNVLLSDRDVEAACQDLVAALPVLDGPVVLVANEVGLGIVPEARLGREFRDRAGRLHQDIAAVAQSVVLVVAGLPQHLKTAS